jgi:hypothetical protein
LAEACDAAPGRVGVELILSRRVSGELHGTIAAKLSANFLKGASAIMPCRAALHPLLQSENIF